MLLQLLKNDPFTFILLIIPLLYSLVLHEVAHAFCASLFGDHTAKHLGRISLNPFKHLDPLGTALLLLFGFGWAKPVPINFTLIKPKKRGIICCSLSGVTVNFFIAFFCIALNQLLSSEASIDMPKLTVVLLFTAQINLILAAFNIIPIPPLDGSRVVAILAPPNTQFEKVFNQLERVGMLVLFVLLYFGVLDPIIDFIMNVFLRIITIIL